MSLALKKLHNVQQDGLPEKKTLNLFIAGIGAIGHTLAQIVNDLDHPAYDLNILGICNSKVTQWNPDLNEIIKNETLEEGEATNWNNIPEQLIKQSEGNLIFVDATGSEIVAHQYQHLLTHGIHIATPSKIANSFGQDYFEQLQKSENAHYRFETTVGAGLPVISTIKSLINSGDEITKISGVVSGTMTYLFTQLQNGIPFSEAVIKAKENGYSEPDPRDDLSGEDVARKFLILARTSGFKFERNQIEVESLVPEELIPLDTNTFLSKLNEYDGHWKSRNAKALVNNRKLRYTGRFTPEGISVGVEEVKSESPIGGLSGTDNLIQIFTKRYQNSPITIQGPGAGKEVTAAGVLSDILEIGNLI